MQLYFASGLSVAALVTWVVVLRSPARFSRMQLLAYHIAPLAAVWLVALLTPAHDVIFYKGAVLVGIVLATIGFALHDSEFLPSYVLHSFLMVTYTLYAYAFSSQTSGWPTLWVLLLVAMAGALYYWLYPTLHELWISVAVYAFFIFLATWQALELAVQQPSSWMGWAALVGMLLAIAATLLEAQSRFLRFRPSWAAASLPIFFLAQLAIAWSVWG